MQGAVAGNYNGSSWTGLLPPGHSDGSQHWLNAVAPASATSVWAVGNRTIPNDPGTYVLLDFWNGSTWAGHGGPNPISTNFLGGVTAVPGSTTEFWAVGSTGTGPTQTLILHTGP